MKTDGRNSKMRTSLCNSKSVVKKDREKNGKGDRKKTGIKELIGKFGGGDGKRKPFDRTEKEESESEGMGEVINLGLSRI